MTNKNNYRAITIDQLPIPQSRIEEFLEFLCYNGAGGLTQAQVQAMINELVKNAAFNEATKSLTLTKENGQTIEVDLLSLATKWDDLEHISQYSLFNLFDKSKVIDNSYWNNVGSLAYDSEWTRYVLEVKPGQTLSIVKKQHDSSNHFCFAENGPLVGPSTTSSQTINGWTHYKVTVPNDATIAKLGVNIHKPTNNINEVMVYEGHDDPPINYIPFTNGREILMDSAHIAQSFDNSGTDLTSQTIHDAIVEVNDKISKANASKVFDTTNNIWDAAYFRIPALLRTKEGSLLATSDIRYHTANDQSLIDIGVARSVDNGNSWDCEIAMQNNREDANRSRVMDSTMLQTSTGKLILLAGGWDTNANNWTGYNAMPDLDWNPYIVTSTDDGVTWSEKVSLKEADKCANQPQGTVAWLGGVGTGIEMKDGTLIFPIQICYFTDATNATGKVTKAGLIYSMDDGETWTMSRSFVDGTENMMVEVHGSLIMNARNGNYRASYMTSDLGTTWETYEPLHNKILNRNYGCQGSFIAFDTYSGHRVGLISTPKNLNNNYTRDNITIYMIDFDHKDGGIIELLVPYPYTGNSAGAGYSSLAYGVTKEGQRKLDIIYEDDGSISHQEITFLLSEIEDIISKNISNTSWSDLDGVQVVKPFVNLYNHEQTVKFENTGAFNSSGGVGSGSQWYRIVVPVESGKSYHIHSKRSETNTTPAYILGSSDFVYFQTDASTFDTTTRIYSERITSTTEMNGKNIITFTPPTNSTHAGFNLNAGTGGWSNAEDEFMIWESSQPMPDGYVADKIEKSITIGKAISLEFDPNGTTLSSPTIHDAIIELDSKVENKRLNPHAIGEYKTLAYDAGEVAELNDRTWLRCGGQAVSIAEYRELYNKMGSQIASINVDVENIVGDFDLPTNPLPIGYLYICAK